LQNADAFNGDIKTADFVVENINNLVKSGTTATLKLTAPNPISKSTPGTGIRISSTSYLMYGKFTARLKAGPVGGMVTSFISMSDEKDEIDWEWTGGRDINKAQTNFFIKGAIDYTKSIAFDTGSSTAETSHEYAIEWTESEIKWYIDGKVVRTVFAKDNIGNYPNTPSRIQFAVWDGGAGAEGTRNWAGGYIDWNAAKSYNAVFEYVVIQCAGDAAPTTVPQRPAGFKAPSLTDKAIAVAIPGLPGYASSGINGVPAGNAGTSSKDNGEDIEDPFSGSYILKISTFLISALAILM